jgi:hypothetical protein
LCWQAANAGCNVIRFLPEVPFHDIPKREVLTRFKFNDKSSKWNLFQANETYFNIVKRIQAIAKEYGLILFIDLFDHCQHHPKENQNKTSPFRSWNNIHNIKNYQENTTITSGLIIQTVKHLGIKNIIYCLGNEILPIKNYEPFVFTAFRTLLDLGVKPDQICLGQNLFNVKNVGMTNDLFEPIIDDTFRGYQNIKKQFVCAVLNDQNLDKYPIDTLDAIKRGKRDRLIRPIHKFMDVDKSYKPFDKQGYEMGIHAHMASKDKNVPTIKDGLLFSDDGTLNGEGLKWGIPNENRMVSRPSALQWYANSLYLLQRGCVGFFEHLPLDRWNLEHNQSIFGSISKAYKKKYAKFPENYNKYLFPEVKPDEPIEPEKPPIPGRPDRPDIEMPPRIEGGEL